MAPTKVTTMAIEAAVVTEIDGEVAHVTATTADEMIEAGTGAEIGIGTGVGIRIGAGTGAETETETEAETETETEAETETGTRTEAEVGVGVENETPHLCRLVPSTVSQSSVR